MLTFEGFTGINNVLPPARLTPEPKSGLLPLADAMNCDIGLAREIMRRDGFAEVSDICHKNVHQANGFMLATVDGGDLTAIDGATSTVLYPSLGVSRVWYTNLPDGRTTFSNGAICGIASVAAATKWGVPLPAGVGTVTEVAGSLMAGRYKYQVHHYRLSDGLEGGPTYAGAFELTEGGFTLTGLPLLAGHGTRIYLSSHNDDIAYLAGNTTTSAFAFSAANDTLTIPCKTDNCYPAPAGILTAFWRGRMLLASGNLLLASRPQQWELFDLAKDFKQFSADITMVQPVDGGIFVGTEQELVFLAGTQWDSLAARHNAVPGGVVLGSGVTVPAGKLKEGLPGDAMLCIANRLITAGYPDGGLVAMTEGRYATDVTEVTATFRMRGDIPQYIAIEQ